MQLAKHRGEALMGADAIDTIAARREAKAQQKKIQRDQ